MVVRGGLRVSIAVGAICLLVVAAIWRTTSPGDGAASQSASPPSPDSLSTIQPSTSVERASSTSEQAWVSLRSELNATIRMVEATHPELAAEIERTQSAGAAGAQDATVLEDQITRVLDRCQPTRCTRLRDLPAASVSTSGGVRLDGVVDPPQLWAGALSFPYLVPDETSVHLNVADFGNDVSGTMTVAFAQQGDTENRCGHDRRTTVNLTLVGHETVANGTTPRVFAGSATGSWNTSAGSTEVATGYWFATQSPEDLRLHGTLIPPSTNFDPEPWSFIAAADSDPATLLAELRVRDAPTPFPKPAMTVHIETPRGPVLAYTTTRGVFISDEHGRASQVDIVNPDMEVSAPVVSQDGRLVSWSVAPPLRYGQFRVSQLVVLDLDTHRRDTYAWNARSVDPYDRDTPPRLAPAPHSLIAAYHHRLLRFSSDGQVTAQPLTIPTGDAPGLPAYFPCGFNEFETIGELNGRTLVTARYPTGGVNPGSYVFAVDTDSTALAFAASDGPRDVMAVGPDELLFIDRGHQWATVQRARVGDERGSTIDIPAPGPPPAPSLGNPVQADRITNREGQIFVTYRVNAGNYDAAHSYVAVIDDTGVHNIDLQARWVEAGPNRSLAYIDNNQVLSIRDQAGSGTPLATEVTAATWAGTPTA